MCPWALASLQSGPLLSAWSLSSSVLVRPQGPGSCSMSAQDFARHLHLHMAAVEGKRLPLGEGGVHQDLQRGEGQDPG
jgi:hypothetical protein